MRTFKAFCLSVLPRAVDLGDRFYLCLNVFAAFDIAAKPKLLLEQTLWSFLPGAATGFVEPGMPKVRSEYLLFGHAYAPGGVATPQCHIGVRFAGRAKALTVWGARRWDGRHISPPEPFTKVPLGWAGGFGGAGYADNPAGLGFVPDKLPPEGLPLPRFEDPMVPWARQPERNKAVAFSPIEIENPRRTRFQGTYDDTWLKQRSPGMPLDFDWRFFQVAPEDQQFDQLAGNEAYELHHLHPSRPLMHGSLPGIRPSAFIRRIDQQRDLEPVPTALRTVLFFPELERLVLIWQGVAKTADDELGDISHLLVGAEHLGLAKPIAHYQQVFEQRADREQGMLAALREDALLPDGLPFEPLVSVDGLLTSDPADSYAARSRRRAEKCFEAARAEVARYGLNPDKHAPPAKLPQRPLPNDIKDLPTFFAELKQEAEVRRAAAHDEVEASLRATEAQLAPLGYDGAIVRGEIKAPPSGPPAPVAPDRITGMKALAAAAKASGVEVGEIHRMAIDEALHAQWQEGDQLAIDQYRQAAHHQQPASRAEQRHAKRQREWVLERLKARQPLAGFDLTGADLRGIDLRSANLDNALLESAQLDEVKLDGATLRGAVLAHAHLRAASLGGCDLTRANLGKADLTQASADQAVFCNAVLSEAKFVRASLRGARFNDAQVVGVVFTGATLDGACLEGLLLSDTRFDGASLIGALAHRTVFMKASLAGARLSRLQAKRVVFYAVEAQQIDLDGAQLEAASFVEGTRLARCSLRQAELGRAMARGTSFAGCDFSQARLDGALFAHADLGDATLLSVSAVEANFMRAELRNADFRGANLRGAFLTAALANGTRFDGANLFGADLARVVVDAASSFNDALMAKARLYPRAARA